MNRNRRALIDGVIWKQLLKFFLPIMLGTFFQQLYNTADALILGNFVGKHALAAVGGSASQIISLMVGFFVGLTSGAAVVISQYYGADDTALVSRAVHNAVAVAIVAGLLLMALGIPLAQPMLKMMGTPEDALVRSAAYLRIYFMGIVPQLLFNAGSSILRALGDSKRPLYYLIVCCAANIVLDILFVAGFHMGVEGAAIATIISQALSAVLVLSRMMRAQTCYRLSLRKIKLEPHLTAAILRIGLPEGLQAAMYSISNIYIQAGVNQFGTDMVAAWAVLGKIDGLHWMVMGAFGITVTTFSGQNFGARQYVRLKQGVRTCSVIALSFSALFSFLLYFWGEQFFHLFGADAQVAQNGLALMKMICPFYFLYPLIEILSGAMRGAGEVLLPTLMTLAGVCVFRTLWVYLLLPLFPSMSVIVYSYPISWLLTTTMFLIYYKKGNWMRRAL